MHMPRHLLSSRIAPLMLRWSALPLNDRRALSVLGAFMIIMVLWFGIISPIINYADRAQARLLTAQADLAWMQANAAAARRAGTVSSVSLKTGQSLLAAVNSSAREAGLNLQRFEPAGEQRVSVTLENAVFTDVMAWLVTLEKQYGFVIQSVSADNQPQAGIVNIRLTLEQSS